MSRARTVVFTVIAVGVLAFAAYIDIVDSDVTALLFGIFIVLLLYVTLAILLPRMTGPPASRLP